MSRLKPSDDLWHPSANHGRSRPDKSKVWTVAATPEDQSWVAAIHTIERGETPIDSGILIGETQEGHGFATTLDAGVACPNR